VGYQAVFGQWGKRSPIRLGGRPAPTSWNELQQTTMKELYAVVRIAQNRARITAQNN
jgi:hypothetical protein